YWMARKLVKVKHFSLPNLLLPEPLVPEFLQENVAPAQVGKVLLEYLNDEKKVQDLTRQFAKVHEQLKRNANVMAATAVLELLDQGR
ncbi:MAG TPA: lipid-A-disaccharide synthase, partial [Gammaproteobacteria bacterium]